MNNLYNIISTILDIQQETILNLKKLNKHIGEIFAYPGTTPPVGAYLLNGQTINNCKELYPKFWKFVNSENIRKIDNETYETELTSCGVCGGFVVNTETYSVRLPSLTQGTLWGNNNSNIG